MSVKRSSIRKRRLSRKRIHHSTYLTVSQKKQRRIGRAILILSSAVILGAAAVLGIFIYDDYLRDRIPDPERRGKEAETLREAGDASEPETRETVTETTADAEKIRKEQREAFERAVLEIEPGVEFAHFKGEPTLKKTGDALLDKANVLAAGYDYEAALELLKSTPGYSERDDYVAAIYRYTAEQSGCRIFSVNNNVTHVFFHSLIVDPSLAFSKEVAGVKAKAYNEAMTTVSEFTAMIEEMYAEGFVLVDIYDLCRAETLPDGSEVMRYQKIYLPEGKKPFILSVDDTNYYEYMTGHGFAAKLVVTEEGRVQNELVLTDGTVVTGSFDVLPILEDFIEMHPDFSYRGGRGIMGITGYNGVLGYRTSDYWYSADCPYYEATEENEKYKREEILSGTNQNIQEDKETASEVAQAIRSMGWRFASHTWGHKRLGQVAMTTLNWDSDMWDREVRPILGDTDLLIFPYGDDFGPASVPWQVYDYDGYNERYEAMKAHGFRYFFNVDSSIYYMQRTDEYFRQGRRNLDGERLWEAYSADQGTEGRKNRLTDLFANVAGIIDPLRPMPED